MANLYAAQRRHTNELRRFFQCGWFDSVAITELFRCESHKLPRDMAIGPYGIERIERLRTTWRRLTAAPEDVADVLAWMFELRLHAPRLQSLVGEYPGVAIRTSVARAAFDSMVDNEHPSKLGIAGFICELAPSNLLIRRIRDEKEATVRRALEAYARTAEVVS